MDAEVSGVPLGWGWQGQITRSARRSLDWSLLELSRITASGGGWRLVLHHAGEHWHGSYWHTSCHLQVWTISQSLSHISTSSSTFSSSLLTLCNCNQHLYPQTACCSYHSNANSYFILFSVIWNLSIRSWWAREYKSFSFYVSYS